MSFSACCQMSFSSHCLIAFPDLCCSGFKHDNETVKFDSELSGAESLGCQTAVMLKVFGFACACCIQVQKFDINFINSSTCQRHRRSFLSMSNHVLLIAAAFRPTHSRPAKCSSYHSLDSTSYSSSIFRWSNIGLAPSLKNRPELVPQVKQVIETVHLQLADVLQCMLPDVFQFALPHCIS